MKIAKDIKKAAGTISALTVLLFFLAGGPVTAWATSAPWADTISAVITDYVEKNAPWPAGTVRIIWGKAMKSINLSPPRPPESLTYQVKSSNGNFVGDTTFLVRIYEGGNLIKEERVPARLEVLQDVVVAVRFLGKDHVITEDDVVLIKRWSGRLGQDNINSLEGVIGKRLLASVSPQGEIKAKMITQPPLIKKGTRVRIVLDKGPLNISSVGLAEQDGSLGETIKVRNISSQKIIYAKIVNDFTVQVDF